MEQTVELGYKAALLVEAVGLDRTSILDSWQDVDLDRVGFVILGALIGKNNLESRVGLDPGNLVHQSRVLG